MNSPLTKSNRWAWKPEFEANSSQSKPIIFSPIETDYAGNQSPANVWRAIADIAQASVDANKSPASPTGQSTLEVSFRRFADQWYADTMRDSSISRMTSNNNYLKVISLGSVAVPLILRELKSKPRPWFLALRILTGETEIGNGNAGDFEKIAKAWISWGETHGFA